MLYFIYLFSRRHGEILKFKISELFSTGKKILVFFHLFFPSPFFFFFLCQSPLYATVFKTTGDLLFLFQPEWFLHGTELIQVALRVNTW